MDSSPPSISPAKLGMIGLIAALAIWATWRIGPGTGVTPGLSLRTKAVEPSMSLLPAGDENFLRGIFWEDEANRPLLHKGDLVMSPADKTSYLRCLITKLPPGPEPVRLHFVAIASDTGSLEIALEEQDGEFRENWVARVPIEPGHNRTDLILKPHPEGQLLRSPRSFNGDGIWNPNGMPVQFHLRYPSGDCRISKLDLIFPAETAGDGTASDDIQ